MICNCGEETEVINSRRTKDRLIVRRRRECVNGHRFSTHEELSLNELTVSELNERILAASKMIIKKLRS